MDGLKKKFKMENTVYKKWMMLWNFKSHNDVD